MPHLWSAFAFVLQSDSSADHCAFMHVTHNAWDSVRHAGHNASSCFSHPLLRAAFATAKSHSAIVAPFSLFSRATAIGGCCTADAVVHALA